jgi:hypothetical protein
MGTFLRVPGWTVRFPSDGWAALNRVRASAETAPAATPRRASERRDRYFTDRPPQMRRVYRKEVGRSPPNLKWSTE